MQVYHSLTLTREQKDRVVAALTKLHSTTFRTPTLFVNVRFVPTEPHGDFYVGGTRTEPESPNRIMALVRMGADRSKKMFDDLALKIEAEWNDIVGYNSKLHQETNEEKARKLHLVAFTSIIGARENGILLPGVSNILDSTRFIIISTD